MREQGKEQREGEKEREMEEGGCNTRGARIGAKGGGAIDGGEQWATSIQWTEVRAGMEC